MYLILGNASDPCCVQVAGMLGKCGHDVRLLDDIFAEPHRLLWRFGGESSTGPGSSRIGVPGVWEVASGHIEGVLVRCTPTSALDDLSEEDARYASLETQAALLAWLWSLPMPVVNRPPAWLFYQPRPPFLLWAPLLGRAGLRVPSTLISNDPQGLRYWRSRYTGGSVLAPLSDPSHLQVHTDSEWEAVLRLARHAPVVLKEAHGEIRLACIVGDLVIWDRAVADDVHSLEHRLLDFARIAELDFVQIAVTLPPAANEPYSVVAIDPQVQFFRFCTSAQHAIAEALADLLTGSQVSARERQSGVPAHAVTIHRPTQ